MSRDAQVCLLCVFIQVGSWCTCVQCHIERGTFLAGSPAACLGEVQRPPGVPFPAAVDWLGDRVALEKVGEGD